MTMPDELFYPVGIITCIMVFTANIPHKVSDRKTWFGYWKNDGFVKTKHRGRIDLEGRWPSIRQHWVDSFRNREVHVGESVLHKVTADDEWCAEAYMETDYQKVGRGDFERAVRDFMVFRLLGEMTPGGEDNEADGVEQSVYNGRQKLDREMAELKVQSGPCANTIPPSSKLR